MGRPIATEMTGGGGTGRDQFPVQLAAFEAGHHFSYGHGKKTSICKMARTGGDQQSQTHHEPGFLPVAE